MSIDEKIKQDLRNELAEVTNDRDELRKVVGRLREKSQANWDAAEKWKSVALELQEQANAAEVAINEFREALQHYGTCSRGTSCVACYANSVLHEPECDSWKESCPPPPCNCKIGGK
jgi:hypothetical protein